MKSARSRTRARARRPRRASPAAATQSGGNLGETETVNRADDDDGDFPWGLLGLLGLAGLAGLKRNERDIHVDAAAIPNAMGTRTFS